MKRLTLTEATERMKRMDSENTCLMLAVNALAADTVKWLPKFKVEGGYYRMGYFGLDRANGGYVLTQWICEGQKPYTTVMLLDEMDTHYTHYASLSEDTDSVRRRVAEIMRERYRVLNPERQETAA